MEEMIQSTDTASGEITGITLSQSVAALPKAFVVIGSSGEYSDRWEWTVAICASEEDAEALVRAIDYQVQQIPQHMRDARWRYEAEMKKIVWLDPYFSTDYTGTHYSVSFAPMYSSADVEAAVKQATPMGDPTSDAANAEVA